MQMDRIEEWFETLWMHPFQISPGLSIFFVTGAFPVANCIYIICSERFWWKLCFPDVCMLLNASKDIYVLNGFANSQLWKCFLSPMTFVIFLTTGKGETGLHKKAFCKISQPTSDLWSERTEPLPSQIPNTIHFVAGRGKPCFVIYTDGSRYPMKKKLCNFRIKSCY